MDVKDHLNSVPDEQFGGKENTDENMNDSSEENKTSEKSFSESGKIEDIIEPSASHTEAETRDYAHPVHPDPHENDNSDDIKDESGSAKIMIEDVRNKPGNDFSDDNTENDKDTETSEIHNYSLLSKEDMVELLENFILQRQISEIRKDVEILKSLFYKKLRTERDELLKSFLSEGGNPEDFKPVEDPYEQKVRELLKRFREHKAETNRNADDEKNNNLQKKNNIIDEIKELINSQESINKTFQEFRDLQERWRNIGPVPQAALNDLWENYHHHVEMFYDYIKINKELRDLDLKKNLEEKISLIEKTGELANNTNVLNAFKVLQNFHEQWREIGPVPIESRNEIWNRFKEATAIINRKHQQYYQNLRDQQKKNLEQKLIMCERAEKFLEEKPEAHKGWIKRTNDILELQKAWKAIGFAPKKENNEVYARFRKACDSFFESKRDFYSKSMKEHNSNYVKKTELCEIAEKLKDSTDWKKTTDELISLQKKWKEIGPVPRKHSDQIWKRFREACDTFFNNKAHHFKDIDAVYENNLKEKRELIEEIKAFAVDENLKNNLDALHEFKRRWAEIGFVPIDKKEEVQNEFSEAINLHFDKLDVDEVRKNVLKYESKLENIAHKPGSGHKLKFEREKFMNKLLQLKTDISVYENNIGFFANSANADEMKRDFELKIESAKQRIKLLEEKINLIDELGLED